MLKVFLDKLLLKNPSSARTTLKFETFFGKIGIEDPQFENDLEVFYQKVTLKNPQFGQTILAVEACKEPAIRGQNLRFYCQHLTEIFLSPLIVCSLQASRTTPRNFFGVVRPFAQKIPYIASRSFPNVIFWKKCRTGDSSKAAFGKNPLQASRSFPNWGYSTLFLVKKKFFQTSFGSFGKIPYKYKSLKKRFQTLRLFSSN